MSSESMTVKEYLADYTDNNNALLPLWITIGVATATLTVLVTIVVIIALALYLRKSSQKKTECDNSYSVLHREENQQLQSQSLHTPNDLYNHIQLSPSTGQAEFISKTETGNTKNNPSP